MVSSIWRIEGFRGILVIVSYGINEYGDGPAGYVGEFPACEAQKLVIEHNRKLQMEAFDGRS